MFDENSKFKKIYDEMQTRNISNSNEKLSKAKVVIAGAGGLGSNIAIALARIGVGNLIIIDFDTVEYSNLNRQQYKLNQVGLAKAIALKQNIAEVNPFISVTPIIQKINLDNIEQLFNHPDIICEAFDDPAQKAMLLSRCCEIYPNIPIVMASGMAGIHSSNSIKTKEIKKNVYIVGDRISTGAEGLMAPRVMIAAGHQANMITRLIMNKSSV